MVTATEPSRLSRPPRVAIVTALSQTFIDWCLGKGYPLEMDRLLGWQREYRAERRQLGGSPYYYEQFTSAELQEKITRLQKQLNVIQEVAANKA